MKIGTYYYPEQWPREQWQRDFDNIAAMGLSIVHMAEFAWFTMEPKPGEFHFDWLDECVEMARQRSLDVILCTPTAAPPIWLSTDSPETMPIDQYERRDRFGGRRHYSPTSPAMQEATARIVTAMAKHFGQHESIVGWQIDNEYSGNFDQSDHTHVAFREWLKRKYQTIEALNLAWGCQFWNTYYTSFDQILMPRERTLNYDNPHHKLDASRFWSWAFANFNKLQADILRQHIGDRFITSNFMPFHLDANPADMMDGLSLFAWDSYPVSGAGTAHPDETYRLADPAAIGIVHDQMASYTGRWALLEVQPGQVNWSGVPVLLYPGAVRLWLWTAYAHGAEFLTTYRYRQPRFGTELFHHGLMAPDGVTQSAGGREFVQVIDEMKMLRAGTSARAAPRAPIAMAATTAPPVATTPAAAAQSRIKRVAPPPVVGLIFDFDQLWYFQTLPQARRWSQPRWMIMRYAAAACLGLEVKSIRPEQPIPPELPIVIAPGVQMVDDELVNKWDGYATAGGNLLLTCRTALMDRTGQLWEGPLAAPIIPLIGATIEAYDGLPDDTWAEVEMDGVKHAWNVWGDLLYAEPTTKVLAKFSNQFYAGAVAATRNRRGSGTVTYCGVYSEQTFVDALLEKLAGDAGLPMNVLPPRVHLLKRGAHRILLNYRDKPITAPAPKGTKFLVGSATVEPAGVAVWEET
ncbi:hypothetical protein BH09PLA1_BH09PLA1_29180 [soil metagenome]